MLKFIEKLEKLEFFIKKGIDCFLKTTKSNETNLNRRNLFVKIMTLTVRHPFFVWGRKHDILQTDDILLTSALLIKGKEISGTQLKTTISVINMFIEWTRRTRKFGLNWSH